MVEVEEEWLVMPGNYSLGRNLFFGRIHFHFVFFLYFLFFVGLFFFSCSRMDGWMDSLGIFSWRDKDGGGLEGEWSECLGIRLDHGKGKERKGNQGKKKGENLGEKKKRIGKNGKFFSLLIV